jgi:hypothetical protein
MLKSLQSRKVELNEATRQAIYRALQERDVFLHADTGYGAVYPVAAVNIYRHQWSDSASQLEAQWQEAFNELEAARSRNDPEFILPPPHAFDIATTILELFKLKSMGIPEITLDGDGSLYLEWESGNKRLSICLSSTIPGSYIYVGAGEEYDAYPLTVKALKESLASYLT